MRNFITRKGLAFVAVTAVVIAGTAVAAEAYRKKITRKVQQVARIEIATAQKYLETARKEEAPVPPYAFDPCPLPLTPEFGITTLRKAGTAGGALTLPFPVSIVHREGSKYYVCNYHNLYLLDLAAGHGQEVLAPPGLSTPWVPTGLFYDTARKKLYVANYTNANVLVLDASNETQLRIAATIRDPAMKGPEGVAVSSDGRHVAVADYDGNAIFLFSTQGELLWKHTAPMCHGVDVYRGKDGREYVVGTSLGLAAVLKLDLSGKLLRQVSNRVCHGAHGYLYPTAVMTRPDGLIAVTDAYRGQVSFLDEDLGAFAALGGNGPGPGLFSAPYGSSWAGSDRLLVADTFRDRLVEVSLKTRAITAIYYLVDPGERQSTIPGRFARECELDALTSTWALADLGLIQGEAFGKNHQLLQARENIYADVTTSFGLPLPHFNAAVREKLGDSWHPGISGLVSAKQPRAEVWSLSVGELFTDYPLRFLYGVSYQHEGQTYLLLGAPQSQDVLVCGRGVTIPIPLRKDVWLVGETLVGRDFALPARRVVELGAQRIQAFLDRLATTAPLQTIKAEIFPKWSDKEFRQAADRAAWSPEGKTFVRECWEAQDAAGQRAAAERFVASCLRQKSLHLAEIVMAEMVLADRAAPDDQ